LGQHGGDGIVDQIGDGVVSGAEDGGHRVLQFGLAEPRAVVVTRGDEGAGEIVARLLALACQQRLHGSRQVAPERQRLVRREGGVDEHGEYGGVRDAGLVGHSEQRADHPRGHLIPVHGPQVHHLARRRGGQLVQR
jgi:hypothetical protein